MKTTTLLFVALTASSSVIAAASDILARSAPGSHVLSLDFKKEKSYSSKGHPRHRKVKRGTVVATLDNEYLLYYVEVKVGTPPQNLKLQIDTGSSDVWAPSANSKYCRGRDKPCDEGSFSRDGFSIGYVDGSHAKGDYISEVFHMGNITINDMQIGIGSDTDISAGILGIGYAANSVSQTEYPGLVDNLVAHGYINSRAYSLYLNDQESNTGSILFGGIDTNKYRGHLIGLPIELEDGSTTPTDFLVALTSVGFVNKNGTESTLSNRNLAVVLDSGSSLTYLPNSTVTAIIKKYGGRWNSDIESYQVPCSLSNNHDEFLTYRFGGPNGPVIRVSMEELTNYVIDTKGHVWTDDDGNPACIFGIQPQPKDFGDTYLFGDTFLRSAYVVYDLDGQKIWLAQTIFNATSSRIVEIHKSSLSKSGVPDASGVESDVSVMPTATTVQKPRPTVFTVGTSTTSARNATYTAPATVTQTTGQSTNTSSPNAGLQLQVGGTLGLAIAGIACLFSFFL
ncbi:Candidapepsin-2 [Dactylellina cionopaga]|nr:Candidapepsin-2 [Dactylellina cionopaga]